MQPKVNISIKNLIHNYEYVRSITNKAAIFAVVKANAYGHGSINICDALSKAGIDGFCVALVSEIVNLRDNGIDKPILHIGKFNVEDLELFTRGNTYCTINSVEDINAIIEFTKGTDKKVYSHLKFDTGMTRMGAPYEKYKHIIDMLSSLDSIITKGLFTHFADADSDSNEFMDIQLERFNIVKDYAKTKLQDLEYLHIANSATILKGYPHNGNTVRPGISLYGINPLGEVNENLKPVMKFFAPITAIKNVKKGDFIGYNRKYQVNADMKVAIVQAGYADGVPVEFCNKAFIDFNGINMQVLGKVSMDLFCINCLNIDAKIGEYVTIWGSAKTHIEQHSKLIDKNLYTYTTKIGARVDYTYD